ncbi:FAD-binding oxidoreductase [Nocardioides kongjuensis]|uniref:FAD/FMN-containing dehydrogenase n=1 Tax=Nocardioides kongjuensis TaxID=349522 RepID=A0A852RKE4_9ACTN|nr:FAD/FMN-containing dehydrogenase [Nocardioides kongjuensis]
MRTDSPRLTRSDPGFEKRLADLVFNQLPVDRRPDVVVRPRTEQDVVDTVRAARRDGHQVAVLSGGHSWIAAPVREGGVLIDMSAFDGVDVDAERRRLRVGPAARSSAIVPAVAAHGLAYSSGHCGTPGAGGYLLGGGIGVNSGHWKPACYSVRSVRVVTAEGELVVASESENRDLLWLARGAGPLFPGVVTEFELDLQDRPVDTRVSSWVFDHEHLAAVSAWVSRVSATLPSYVEVFTAAGGPGRHDHLPSEGYPDRIVTVLATAYVDTEAEARAALAPFADGPGVEPLACTDLAPVAYEDLSASFDAEYPDGHRYLADAFWTDLDAAGAMVPLADAFVRAPSGLSNFVALMPGNGKQVGLDPRAGAYSMDHRTLVMAYALWTDPAADEANARWIEEMSAILAPLSVGNFVSEADHERHPERLERSFSPESWRRLTELRSTWDPDGLFHLPGRPR